MTPIRLKVLGKCTLHVDGVEHTVLLERTGKGTGILILLCLSEGAFRETLYLQELLWPDSEDPEKRAGNYRVQVGRLRDALGARESAVIVIRRSIRLDMTQITSDLNTFLHCIKQSDWQGALDAYGGPLLLSQKDAWADDAREQLHKQYIEALAARVNELKQLKPEEAMVILDRWSKDAPECEEQIKRLRWEILVIQNRHAEALADAEAYCARNPDAEQVTRSWLKRLQKPARLTELPPLPRPWTRFVGRQDELTQLVGRVRGERLFTLHGEGGIGKTRMALELAERLYKIFDEQVAFVDLSKLPAGSDADAIKNRLEQTLNAPVATIVRAHALVVLDNAEHVLPAVKRVVPELLEGPLLQLLITSRQELGFRHERKQRLHGLLADDAAELFLQISPVLENLSNPAEKAALERLCERLEGWPLAIELTASRREAFDSLQALQANLEQALMEAGASPDDPTVSERERTLNTTLDWSAQLLDEPTRNLWHACPSFVGGISPEALAGVTKLPVETVQAALKRLTLVSLVQQEGERFRLLEPVRAYLRPKETVQKEFATYFLGLAESAPGEAVLTVERANLVAAGEWMVDHAPDDALRFGATLWRFWWEHGDLAPGFAFLKRALEAVSEHPLRLEALLGAGALSYWLRLRNEAEEIGKEAQSLAHTASDTLREARAWLNWGLAAMIYENQDTTLAEERFRQAEQFFEAEGSARGVRVARSNQLYAATVAGEDGWEQRFEETLAEFDAAGDIDGWLTEACNFTHFLMTRANRKHEAAPYFQEIVRRANKHAQRRTLLQGIQGVATIVADADAAVLIGALDRLRLDWGLPLTAEVIGADQVHRWHCESVLGGAAWKAALDEGAALTDEEVAQRALESLERLIAS